MEWKENRKEEGASLVGQPRGTITCSRNTAQSLRSDLQAVQEAVVLGCSNNKATSTAVFILKCLSTSAHGAYCLQLNMKCETTLNILLNETMHDCVLVHSK